MTPLFRPHRFLPLALLMGLGVVQAAELPYRGRLDDGGQPAQGRYDFRVRLFDAANSKKALAEATEFPGVEVDGGKFVLPLELDGAAGTSPELFAEIEVRAPDQTAYETLPVRAQVKGLAALACWSTEGNDNLADDSFLGTLDTTPLQFRVDNVRVAHMANFNPSPILIYGSASNLGVAPGATISGGGAAVGVDAGYGAIGPNVVSDGFGTVSGGASNRAGNNNGLLVTDAAFATVGGGQQNIASGEGATVAGGGANTASGTAATVPGGRFNVAAGANSFAAGLRAKANHAGSFVWADNTNADFVSTAANQLLLRASGGIGIGTNSPAAKLHMRSAILDLSNVPANRATELLVEDTDAEIRIISDGSGTYGSALALSEGNNGSSWFIYRQTDSTPDSALGFAWGTAAELSNGSTLKPFLFFPNGTAIKPGGGAWAAPSDLRLKSNVTPITGALDRLLQLEGVSFEYIPDAIKRGAGNTGTNFGFIAQQVQEVFPEWVGEAGDGYLYVEERGTTALVVEALRELRGENDALREENRAMKAQLAAIQARLGLPVQTEADGASE